MAKRTRKRIPHKYTLLCGSAWDVNPLSRRYVGLAGAKAGADSYFRKHRGEAARCSITRGDRLIWDDAEN